MAENEAPSARGIAAFRDALSALRDGLLIVLVLLLLVAPAALRRRLTAAGFIEGSAGVNWKEVMKAAAGQARNAGQQIGDLESKLATAATQVNALAANATDPALAAAIKQLASALGESQEKARLAAHAVKNTVLIQQHVLDKAAPATVARQGWIYVGAATEDKQRWTASATVDARPLNVQPGVVLKIRDESYLRKESSESHAAAPVVAVLGVGTSVEVRRVDYIHVEGGGWLVWANVTRHG
jgi:hypothetical protein